MSEADALRQIEGGRWVVSRAWVMQHTGASVATVARWYAQREQYPPQLQFPEVACTIGRTHYYDQQAVESFWTAWQEDVGTGRLKAAGRRPGDGRGNQGGGSPTQRDRRGQAVATALAALRQAGGYQRGLAAQLAREHGGNERMWQRAMSEARTQYQQRGQNHDDPGPSPQGQPSP
ncbi:hypothetical protein [Streptomyces sp. NPDC096032]|uniref:hypothetical protein n=1 Tax=Streptomyces sp. NPDC096032 TaxID=3366070 RepID=UPI00381CC9F6